MSTNPPRYSPENPQKRIEQHPPILIGKHPTKDEFLASYGQTFLMLAAPPGSGKGVAMMIPNLLTFPDSVVCNDPKFENFNMTAGFRAYCGQKVYRFSPEKLETHQWNPLSRISRDPLYRLGQVREIASVLFTPDNPKNKGWYTKAGDVWLAFVLYLIDSEKWPKTEWLPVTLPQTYEMAALGEGLGEWATDVIAAHDSGKQPLSDETVREVGRIISESKNKSGWPTVLGILTECLALYGEKTVVWALSGDDIQFDRFRQEKSTAYFCVTNGAVKKFGPLMNLFYSQIIKENGSVLPEDGGNNPDGTLKYQYQLLLGIDELAVMGPIEALKTAPALMRGAGLRFMIIFQGKAQLRSEELYGREGANAIMDAFHIEVVFAPGNVEAAKEYSERLGNRTVMVKTHGGSKGKGGATTSHNISPQPAPLMLAQDINALPYEEELIFVQGTQHTPPMNIRARKLFWYKEEIFKQRVNMPVPKIPTGDAAKIASLTVPMRKKAASSVTMASPYDEEFKNENQRRIKPIADVLGDSYTDE